MKKFGAILLTLCLLLGFLPVTANADEVESGVCNGIDASGAIVENKVVTDIKSAVVFELNSSTMMYANNIDTKVYPASFVKIMTALLAIEKGSLTDTVTVTQEALNAVTMGGVSAKLQAGEKLTLRDLLYCMLTGSANDAAAVIAVHIGGDVASFVAMMNNRAAELGCKDTHFVDPHGLKSNGQYTTARDMLRILNCALTLEGFKEIFGAVTYTVPATEFSDARELRTANYLIDRRMEQYYDSRVTGGRTGVAEDQTRCVAVTAEDDNLRVIAIVIGAKSKFAADKYTVEVYGGFREIKKFLDATISSYQIAQVFHEDQIIAQRTVTNGDNDLVLIPSEAKTVVLPKSVDMSRIEYRYLDKGKAYVAPIDAGTVQSGVEIWYSGKCLAKVGLLAKNNVYVASSKLGVVLNDENGIIHPLLIIILLIVTTIIAAALYFRRVDIQRRKQAARRRASARRDRDVGTTTKGM